MKLLLDENLPKRLKSDFPTHDSYTVAESGWNGIKNGELLQLTIENDFDAFLTFDKNLQHQQNFHKLPITVFVLSARTNTYAELTKLSTKVLKYLDSETLPVGLIVIEPD